MIKQGLDFFSYTIWPNSHLPVPSTPPLMEYVIGYFIGYFSSKVLDYTVMVAKEKGATHIAS